MGKMQFKIAKVRNPKDSSAFLFTARVVLYSNIDSTQIADAAARNSMLDSAVVSAVMAGLTGAFENFLLNGHNIQAWPLGSFRSTIKGYANRSIGADTADAVTPTSDWRLQVRYKRSPSVIQESRRVKFEKMID